MYLILCSALSVLTSLGQPPSVWFIPEADIS